MSEYRQPRSITQSDIDNYYAEQAEGAGYRYGDPSMQSSLASLYYGEPQVQMGPSLRNQPTFFESALPYIKATGEFAGDMTGVPSINQGISQMAHGYYGETPRTADGHLARNSQGEFLSPRSNPMMMANGAGNALLGAMMYLPISYTRPLATMGAGFGLSGLDSTMPEYTPSQQQNRMLREAHQTPRGTRYIGKTQYDTDGN